MSLVILSNVYKLHYRRSGVIFPFHYKSHSNYLITCENQWHWKITLNKRRQLEVRSICDRTAFMTIQLIDYCQILVKAIFFKMSFPLKLHQEEKTPCHCFWGWIRWSFKVQTLQRRKTQSSKTICAATKKVVELPSSKEKKRLFGDTSYIIFSDSLDLITSNWRTLSYIYPE